MEIYLDNSATTKVDPEVMELVKTCMEEDFGNAASLHQKGLLAEKRIKKAKEQIADTLSVLPGEIYFTSGGTESNNWAIRGIATAMKRYGNHLITTNVEHPSVKRVMDALSEEGFDVTYIPANEEGIVSALDIEKALRPETILVSIMAVNNEIGAVEPIAEIGALLKKQPKKIYFHVDDIQGYGKLKIHPEEYGIDLLSVSGHKIHSPKGIGFLYIKDGTRIEPLIYGGGQQKGMRSGTENVPGSAGLGLAAEKMYRNLDTNVAHMYALKQQLIDGVKDIPDVRINGKTGKESAPHIVSVSFRDIRSEVLLHALEEKQIYVSSGSACHSNRPSDITTLDGIGVPPEYRDGTIRFSFCETTTEEEIKLTIQALKELCPVLRRFTRE